MEPRVVVNIQPAKTTLAKMKALTKDFSPVFRGPIANKVHEMFGRIFETEGAYIGSIWAPLTPSTLRSKARLHRAGMGILRRFNTLWGSLVKRSSPQGYTVVTPSSLLIGTSVPYAAAHQMGAPEHHLPQRKIVPDAEEVPEVDRSMWENLMVKYLETA